MYKRTEAIVPSEFIAETKCLVEDGQLVLDMNGDPRLDKLLARVQSEISAHHWNSKRNEKEICKKIVSLMHSDEFYGPYDKGMAEIDKKVSQAKYEADLEEKKGIENGPASIKFAELTIQRHEYYAARGGDKLANYATGHLVCREEAAITSYVMDKVGIKNYFCGTRGYTSASHAFIQSKAKPHNIIDATNPDMSFKENLNGGLILNGDIVITRGEDNSIRSYGEGAIEKPGTDIKAAVKARYNDNLDKAYGKYEEAMAHKPRRHYDPTKNITIAEAQDSIMREFAEQDTGKYILGVIPAGGKYDGKLTGLEQMEAENKRLHKKTTAQDIKFNKDARPDRVSDMFLDRSSLLKSIDTNHDGVITPEEFDKYMKSEEKKNKQSIQSSTPKELKDFRDNIRAQVYGKN